MGQKSKARGVREDWGGCSGWEKLGEGEMENGKVEQNWTSVVAR